MIEHRPVTHETSAQDVECTHVPRASVAVPRCSGCHSAPPRKGQRYCRACHTNAQRAYRQRLIRDREKLNAILQRVQELDSEGGG